MRKPSRCLEASIVLVLVLSVGCSPYHVITMNEIKFVERGVSSSSLSSMVKGKPYKVFIVVDPKDGLEYQVHMFSMKTGSKTVSSGYWIGNVFMTHIDTVPVSEDFAFLFFQDLLLFWGFFHEYARCDDELIRRLAPIIVEESKPPIIDTAVNGTY